MVAQALNDLHDRFPGCEMLGLADLTTRMMLITNADTTYRREDLDALCTEAALAFGKPDTPALGDTAASTVIVATPDNLRLYLRDLRDPAEALCCVCSYDVPIDSFIDDARACLDQISHDPQTDKDLAP